MDFDRIFAGMAEECAAESVCEREVTDEMMGKALGFMQAQGYRHSPASVKALRWYLQGYCLYLAGDVGTGKTLFFKTAPRIATKGNPTGETVVLSMAGLLDKTVEEVGEFLSEHNRHELVIDDVGREPQFVEYGKRFEILPWILDRRESSAARTHVTTNLPQSEILSRYGAAVIDRLRGMGQYVRFEGRSLRSPRPRIKFRAAGLPLPGGNGESGGKNAPRSAPRPKDGESTAPAARSA